MISIQENQATGVALNEIPYGYCHCGCGEKTTISPASTASRGRVRGEPIRYLHGHNSMGKNNPQWKGGRHIRQTRKRQYFMVYCPDHPRKKGIYVPEHILIVEKILGKYLPAGAVVHHVDGNGLSNLNNNLVVCENENYHRLLHRRKRAKDKTIKEV